MRRSTPLAPTEVGGAKKDIEATRSDLEATKGRLERANGDMGVMSGLIAHNRDDLEELKRRGDRNYYEFKIAKSKTAQKVGPVQVTRSMRSIKRRRNIRSPFSWTIVLSRRKIKPLANRCSSTSAAVHLHAAFMSLVVFDVGRRIKSPAISRLPRRVALQPPLLRPQPPNPLKRYSTRARFFA